MLVWESDVVTDDVSVRRGKWFLRQSESVDDLALLNCLKQVRHSTKSLNKEEGFFFHCFFFLYIYIYYFILLISCG